MSNPYDYVMVYHVKLNHCIRLWQYDHDRKRCLEYEKIYKITKCH